jgi:hypothetical protein
MGIIRRDSLLQQISSNEQLAQVQQKGEVPEQEHSFDTILGAAFRQENPTVSFFTDSSESYIKDPSFDPISHIEGTEYEDHAEAFIYADNDQEIAEVKERIDRQKQDRQILSESGWVGILSSMAAGILDPTILIPGTAGVKAASTGARIAKGLGTGAALGTAAVGTQEAILQATQDVRTKEETMLAVAAGGILGGILGGAIGGLSKGTKKVVEKELKNIIGGTEETPIPIEKANFVGPRSIGAAEAVLSPAEEGLAGVGKVGGLGEKAVRESIPLIHTPVTEGLTSPSAQMRRFTSDFFQHNFILGKNLKGQPNSIAIESLMKLDEADIGAFQKQSKDAYLKYAGLEGKAFRNVRGAIQGITARDKLTHKQFQEQVAKAMRRGDDHTIPEIKEVAQAARKKIDKVFKELQELDLIGENVQVKTAKSYLMRKYDIKKVVEQRTKFRDIISGHLQKTNKNLADPLEASAKADEIIENILGLGDKSLGISELGTRIATKSAKLTKARVFDIPDEAIEEFLVNDADKLVSEYLYKGSSLVRFNRYLREAGFESVSDMKQSLRDDYLKMIDNAATKDKGKLSKALERDLNTLDDFVKVLMGNFARKQKKDPYLQLLRKYQYVRLLGQVTISSIPDMAMPILRHGLPRALKAQFGTLANALADTKFSKLSGQEMKSLGIGVEHEMNNIMRLLQDVDYVPSTFGSRVLDKAMDVADVSSEIFNKATGLAYWNSAWRRISGNAAMGRLADDILAKKVSKKEQLKLLEVGLDDAMVGRIRTMLQQHGRKNYGVTLAGLDHWADKEAAEAFGTAIIKETDATILIPGRGDMPLAVQKTELAKTMFQFKSFVAAATNKILIRGMQQRDARTLMGIVGLMSLGYLSYAIKERIRGRQIDTDLDNMIIQGLTRSGVGGLMADIGFALFGGNSRYAGVNAQGIIMGPSMNFFQDTYSAARGPLDGDLSDGDLKRIRRTLPFQNLFYLRILLNQLGD